MISRLDECSGAACHGCVRDMRDSGNHVQDLCMLMTGCVRESFPSPLSRQSRILPVSDEGRPREVVPSFWL